MKNDELEKCFEFILEVEKLKAVVRRVKPPGTDRYENSAEHSWQAALFALTASRFANEPVDAARVAMMMLVHDIGEIDAGDVFFFDTAGREAAKARELAGVERVFGLLPDDTARFFLELWHEFESGETPEAKFARAIDRVLPMFQNTQNGGQSWRENGVGKEKLLTGTAYVADGSRELWESIRAKVESAFKDLELSKPLN